MSEDPLAKALNATSTSGRAGNVSLIERYFGDRPEVKEAILSARARRLSYAEIATALNQEPDVEVSADIVNKWLKKQGVA